MNKENERKIFVAVAAAAACAVYGYLTFAAPAQPSSSGLQLQEPWRSVLRVTFVVPFLLSWVLGALAVERLMTAGWKAKDAANTQMFRRLSYGALALVLGSWITSLVSQVRNNYVQSSGALEAPLAVAQNYGYVLSSLIAFAFIYRASMGRRQPARDTRSLSFALLLVGILGALWLGTIFTNPSRQVPGPVAGARATYYIPDPLILLTIVTPTLLAWVLGIAGSLNFSVMELGGATKEERKAYARIIDGFLIAVFNSMILNGLLSAGSERLLAAGLGFILVILYAFVLATAVSYWLMYRGAKTLANATP